jgi:hypothetical protein
MKFYITSVTIRNLDRFGVYCLKQGKLYEKNWDLSSFFAHLSKTSPCSLNSNIKLTSLPIPNVIIITKNNIDHRGEIGNLVTTSGYTTKAKPAPKNYIKLHHHDNKLCVCLK